MQPDKIITTPAHNRRKLKDLLVGDEVQFPDAGSRVVSTQRDGGLVHLGLLDPSGEQTTFIGVRSAMIRALRPGLKEQLIRHLIRPSQPTVVKDDFTEAPEPTARPSG